MYKDTTIIIPTLNEGKNIYKLVRLIRKLYPKIEIIVSDDGSKDKTREKAKKAGAKVLDRSKRKLKGLTISVLDAAKLVNRKYVVVIDGDFQHPPEKVKNIVENLRKNYDIVICSRKRVEGNWPLNRRLMSKIAIGLGRLRLIEKFKCKDVVSGFFGIKTNLIKEINKEKFELKGFKILFDILKAVPKEKKVKEIPYVFKIRKGNKSKIKSKHAFIFLRSLFK